MLCVFIQLYHLIKLVNRFKIKSSTAKLYNYIWFIRCFRRKEEEEVENDGEVKNAVPVQWCRIYSSSSSSPSGYFTRFSSCAPHSIVCHSNNLISFLFPIFWICFFINKIRPENSSIWVDFFCAVAIRYICTLLGLFGDDTITQNRYRHANRIKWFVAFHIIRFKINVI